MSKELRLTKAAYLELVKANNLAPKPWSKVAPQLNGLTTYKNRKPKEKPLRVIESASGQVLLVEWRCPECLGKPGWKGCKPCKSSGVMDGLTKAIYNESRID